MKFKMNSAAKVAEQARRSEISFRVELFGIIHATWMKACESFEKHSSVLNWLTIFKGSGFLMNRSKLSITQSARPTHLCSSCSRKRNLSIKLEQFAGSVKAVFEQ